MEDRKTICINNCDINMAGCKQNSIGAALKNASLDIDGVQISFDNGTLKIRPKDRPKEPDKPQFSSTLVENEQAKDALKNVVHAYPGRRRYAVIPEHQPFFKASIKVNLDSTKYGCNAEIVFANTGDGREIVEITFPGDIVAYLQHPTPILLTYNYKPETH